MSCENPKGTTISLAGIPFALLQEVPPLLASPFPALKLFLFLSTYSKKFKHFENLRKLKMT